MADKQSTEKPNIAVAIEHMLQVFPKDKPEKHELWVIQVAPLAIEAAKTIKQLEDEQKERGEKLKAALKAITDEYSPAIKQIETPYQSLREKIVEAHDDLETVRIEDTGEIQFYETLSFTADPAKVPKEYLMVNEAKIKQEIKDGVRKIKGVEIFPKKNIRVMTKIPKE
jgi:Mg2+ and Co2+ transporter CorA